MRQLSYHDPKSDMGSFGNKFRKARESKKLSLDDISNVTKISSRMLKAIEDENFDQLPGGVFNKGFIRAYAKHVGLNADDAVSEYLACLSQEQVNSHGSGNSERRAGTDRRKSAASSSAASKTATQTQSPVDVEDELPGLHLPRAEDIRHKPKEYLGRKSSGIPWLTIAIILVIVLGIALIWIRHSRQLRTETRRVAPPVAKTEAASPDAKGSSQAASQPATPPSATAGAVPHPTDSQSAQTQNSTRSTTPAATATSSANSNQPDAAGTDTEAGQSAAPRAKSAPALNLVIRATENSWISVTADGQTVTQETLIAPAHTTVRANREIVVRVGNAAGVTFSWRGQEIPAQGVESEVKTLVFDAQGIRTPESAPPPQ
jgi:cytoskeleton protein RodZ